MTGDRGDLLVVDDTPSNLLLLGELLRGKGYRVRMAPEGELALQAARFRPPDLILLDISMPGMDGFEVCRRLKADPDLASVPVIFLSALGETEAKVRSFEAGGVDYVTKPIKPNESNCLLKCFVRRKLLIVISGLISKFLCKYLDAFQVGS